MFDNTMHGHGCGKGPMRGGWGMGPGFSGRRSPRGRIRAEILRLLLDGPKHGYELIQIISERSGGMWQPSPGSVYPTLSLLEDQGLVTSTESDSRRTYSLTDAGRQAASEVGERSGPAAAPEDFVDLGREAMSLVQAVRQVAFSGTEAQRDSALSILAEARKSIYRLLAE